MKKLLLGAAIIFVVQGFSQKIQKGGIYLGEVYGNVWIAAPTDAPVKLPMEGINSARNYCWDLVLNGYSDWILPTSHTLKLSKFKNLKGLKRDEKYWIDIKENDFQTYTYTPSEDLYFYIWNNSTANVRCVRYYSK